MDIYEGPDFIPSDRYFVEFYQPLMRGYHPLLNIHSIRKQMLRLSNIDVCDLFMKAIDSGSYISVLVDKQYIPAYDTKESTPHDLFIYGYDADKKVFLVADFFPLPYPSYSESEASFHDIHRGLSLEIDHTNDSWDSVYGVQFIGINGLKSFSFDLPYFRQTLGDYLSSTNTASRYRAIQGIPVERPELHGSLNPKFGMSIYDALCELAEFDLLLLRAVHIIYEHKQVMSKRIGFLDQAGLLDGQYGVQFQKVEEKAAVIRNFVLKQISVRDSTKKATLKGMINQLTELEFDCLDKLAGHLRE
ncbi:hypothetical protein [Paenibacillus tarimensis]|uniref:hypothetical protein n=1 Tax=Paenibacillus tarimensis TaxID=416012 RepID=UPI001F1DA69E|nr:hypothetical protein [Paenibacillus tarimensis]MCF2945598.1 hypothetical protein [Paenibacillus tarimensis]